MKRDVRRGGGEEERRGSNLVAVKRGDAGIEVFFGLCVVRVVVNTQPR
jgi:hypothetical protein